MDVLGSSRSKSIAALQSVIRHVPYYFGWYEMHVCGEAKDGKEAIVFGADLHRAPPD